MLPSNLQAEKPDSWHGCREAEKRAVQKAASEAGNLWNRLLAGIFSRIRVDAEHAQPSQVCWLTLRPQSAHAWNTALSNAVKLVKQANSHALRARLCAVAEHAHICWPAKCMLPVCGGFQLQRKLLGSMNITKCSAATSLSLMIWCRPHCPLGGSRHPPSSRRSKAQSSWPTADNKSSAAL